MHTLQIRSLARYHCASRAGENWHLSTTSLGQKLGCSNNDMIDFSNSGATNLGGSWLGIARIWLAEYELMAVVKTCTPG